LQRTIRRSQEEGKTSVDNSAIRAILQKEAVYLQQAVIWRTNEAEMLLCLEGGMTFQLPLLSSGLRILRYALHPVTLEKQFRTKTRKNGFEKTSDKYLSTH
jgi:hypothetical protein